MTSERAVDGEWGYDEEHHWLVFTEAQGASAIIAFDVQPQWAARLLAAARGEPPEPAGTETRCPLEGVHEHAFRGPHRFHEWDPSSYFTLNDRPPVRTPTLDVELLGRTGLRAAIALIAADWFDTGYENGRLDHGVLADRLFAALRAALRDKP